MGDHEDHDPEAHVCEGHDHHDHNDHDHDASVRISRLDRGLIVGLSIVFAVLLLRPGLAFVAAWRADALIAGGRNAQGLAVARRQLLLTPTDPALWDLAGMASARLGRLAEAEEAYRRVLRLRPASNEHHRLLGQLALRREDHDAAVDLFAEALRRDPADPLNWRGLALAQERGSRLQDAARTWDGFAERFPSGDGTRQAARVRDLIHSGGDGEPRR